MPRLIAIAIMLILTAGYSGVSVAGSDKLSSDTRKELAQARRATAKYHDIDKAYEDGFVDIGFILPGVGCHLLSPLNVEDGVIDITKPEVLIYKDCAMGLGGKAELRSVEHIELCFGTPATETEPARCGTPAPEGYTGDADVWEPFVDGSIWTLHIWLWRHNPAGIFVKINPDITD